MLTAGQERLGILAMLLRQYRLMQHVKIMQYEKLSRQELVKNLGIAPFAAERTMRFALVAIRHRCAGAARRGNLP